MKWTLRWALAWMLATALAMGGCSDDGGKGAGADSGADAGGDDVGEQDTDAPEPDTGDQTPDAAPEETGDEPDAGEERVPGTILIEPEELVLTLAPGESTTVTFTASRVEEDGSLTPLPAPTWTTANPRLGLIDDRTGVWTTAALGGETTITATQGDARGQTTLRVRIEGQVLIDGTTPEDAATFEDGQADPDPQRTPGIVYPEDGTMFPQNILGVTIQWKPAGNQLFRVRFQNRFLDISVITRQQVWLPDEALWRTIVRSSINRQVEVSVEGADSGLVRSGGARSILQFSEDAVFGAIYYWSTADAGLMRLPVGEMAPERFFTPTTPPGSPCVGCHTLSRDGSRVAFNSAPLGIPTGPLMEILTDDPTIRVIDHTQNINGMQPTFSPDGDRIVSGWGGTLTERDANGRCQGDMAFCVTDADCGAMDTCVTGGAIRDLPSPQGYKVAFPDWAPDDRWLVSAGTRSLLGGLLLDFSVPNSSLILYPRPGGDWAAPLVLQEAINDQESHYHPAFSPDSRWIAYNYSAGTTPQPDEQSGILDAELRIISPVTRQPITLTRANKAPLLSNSWPKWAPFDGRYLWLAFSTTRDIGLEPRPPETPQIWVTAIDTSLAGSGQDPSFPAFWLPGQSTTSGNHIPYWAVFEKEPGR